MAVATRALHGGSGRISSLVVRRYYSSSSPSFHRPSWSWSSSSLACRNYYSGSTVRCGSSFNLHRSSPASISAVLATPNATAATGGSRRWFTPLTEEEEEAEKVRVGSLTPFAKDQELRQLNRQIARLEMLRGVNTGELYTWSGRYKQLSRDYGFPLMAYYFCCWSASGLIILAGLHLGGFDSMLLLHKIDARMGWDLANTVNPEYGKIGVALMLNELIEPLRLPIVILTVKPVVDAIFPPKY